MGPGAIVPLSDLKKSKRVCKPGSVEDDHLSSAAVTNDL